MIVIGSNVIVVGSHHQIKITGQPEVPASIDVIIVTRQLAAESAIAITVDHIIRTHNAIRGTIDVIYHTGIDIASTDYHGIHADHIAVTQRDTIISGLVIATDGQ